jgi:hypothetical protein
MRQELAEKEKSRREQAWESLSSSVRIKCPVAAYCLPGNLLFWEIDPVNPTDHQ